MSEIVPDTFFLLFATSAQQAHDRANAAYRPHTWKNHVSIAAGIENDSDRKHKVIIGFDADLVLAAHEQWTTEKARIIAELRKENNPLPTGRDDLVSLFVQYGLTDFNWDWTQKAAYCRGDEYIWMYFVTENERVQAIAILYHPKSSRLDGRSIFYIDYIATAYWNRRRDKSRREVFGAARTLISTAIDHIRESFGYRYGFCLHSLPTAVTYYEGLGMQRFDADPEKENLVYFEASESVASSLATEASA